jgi:hypothetical protein
MIALADLLARGYAPLLAVALVTGLGLAALSRDLVKRLFGAAFAAVASASTFAVLARGDPTLAGGAVASALMMLGAVALGLALLMRVREGFGGVDAGGLRHAEEADDHAERGE